MLSISQEVVVTAHTLICRQPSTGKTEVFTYSPESGTVVSSLRGLINWAGQARWQLDCRLSGHRSALAYSAGVQAESFTRVKLFSQLPAAQIFSKTNPLKGKSSRLAKLRIRLGLACNYRCAYCLQSADRTEDVNVASEDEVNAFFAMVDKAGFDLEPHGLIDIWGGEPLVYYKALRFLIPKLRDRWGYERRISMFTNGTLLTDAIADFLIRYRVKIHISHDGPGFALRHPSDPLQDPLIRRRWLRIFEKTAEADIPLTFFAVINPLNCDLFALRDYFRVNFHPEVRFDFGGAVSEYGDLPASCLIGPEAAETLRRSVLRAVTEEPGKWTGLERRVFNLMGRLIHKTPLETIRYHCNAVDEAVLCVDLKGRVLSCQNRPSSGYTIGSLSDYGHIENHLFTHWSLRPHCRDCLVLGACKGGCPDLSDAELTHCCPNDWAFHFAVFTAAWYLLTGTVIESVEPLPPFLRTVNAESYTNNKPCVRSAVVAVRKGGNRVF